MHVNVFGCFNNFFRLLQIKKYMYVYIYIYIYHDKNQTHKAREQKSK